MPWVSRLLEFVKQRLAETGWNDALYAHCSGILLWDAFSRISRNRTQCLVAWYRNVQDEGYRKCINGQSVG